MALSGDGLHWFLVNASPDIRAQMASFPELHPAASVARNSPLQAVLLTNADLDHTAGLLFLREGEPLHVHAAPSVREGLTNGLAFTTVLDSFCGVVWHEPPLDWLPLRLRDGAPSGLAYRALPLRSPAPIFSPDAAMEGQTLAFHFRDEESGATVLVAPDIFETTAPLREALQTSDAVLFDGTFWSETELGEVRPDARKASDMGHLPIRNGSLALLSHLPARRRIYLHINNTNPIFQPDSAERQAVENAGIEVGYDGLEFEP